MPAIRTVTSTGTVCVRIRNCDAKIPAPAMITNDGNNARIPSERMAAFPPFFQNHRIKKPLPSSVLFTIRHMR